MTQEMSESKSAVKDDPVNHPTHYTAARIEVIDFLEAWNLPFHLSNTIKYICRAGKKDPGRTIEDLEKAEWYLKRGAGYGSVRGMRGTDTKHIQASESKEHGVE